MQQNPYQFRRIDTQGDRQFFFPFLTGALLGGAAVGVTRPRPIYNVAPNNYPPMGPGPYANYSYSYYYPYPYPYGR